MAKKANEKKAVSVKKITVKKEKTVAKKIAAEKAVKPVKRKLGKGLEDISALFLSSVKKKSVPVKKKTTAKKTVTREKIAKAEKTIKKTVKKAKAAVVKAKDQAKKKTEKKKTVIAKTAKPKKKAEVKEKKAVKKAPAIKKVKKETTAKKTVKKTAKKVTKKAAEKKTTAKQSNKKPEVVRMGEAKKKQSSKQKEITKNSDKTKKKTISKNRSASKGKKLPPISELKSLFKKKNAETIEEHKDNIQAEQAIEESKFFVSKAPISRLEEDVYDLPAGYGDNKIVIQVRDPYWLFAYWEISQRKMNTVKQQYGNSLNNSRRVLRVYDITDVLFNGDNANFFYDVDIDGYAKNWYLNVNNPGRSYCVDIGLLLPDGRFVLFARSNFVTTPIDGPSDITDEEWMIVEEDFNKLYGLSAGLGIGLSSGELRKQMKTRLKNLSSGVLSSPAVTSVKSKRDFWLVVNAELIVYGATEPGAELTVQGKPIKLNEDGTFSLRFALPDGEQMIPVEAVSPDKLETRKITPIVKRKTV